MCSAVIAIPLYLCYRLRISLKQKLGLYFALSLGVIIIVFSVVRIVVTNTDGVHPEVSWLALWSVIESSVAVIVACLTSFKALLVDRQRAQTNHRSGSNGIYYQRYGASKDSGSGQCQPRSRSERMENLEMPNLAMNFESASSRVGSSGKVIHVSTERRHASFESQTQMLAGPRRI